MHNNYRNHIVLSQCRRALTFYVWIFGGSPLFPSMARTWTREKMWPDTLRYPMSCALENLIISMWLAGIESFRTLKPSMDAEYSGTTYLSISVWNLYCYKLCCSLLTTPMAVGSSSLMQTIGVFWVIVVNCSRWFSRTSESGESTPTSCLLGCRKETFATLAMMFAKSVLSLPRWGVPRKITPFVLWYISPRDGCRPWLWYAADFMRALPIS